MKHCNKLESFLEHNQHCDIYANELFQELRHLKTILLIKITKSVNILDFIRSYWEDSGFQTIWVSYRILLTLPITVFGEVDKNLPLDYHVTKEIKLISYNFNLKLVFG